MIYAITETLENWLKIFLLIYAAILIVALMNIALKPGDFEPFFFLAPLLFFFYLVSEYASILGCVMFFSPPTIYLALHVLAENERKFRWLNYKPYSYVLAVVMAIWFIVSVFIIESLFHRILYGYILAVYLSGVVVILSLSKVIISSQYISISQTLWSTLLIFLIVSVVSGGSFPLFIIIGLSALCGERVKLLPIGASSPYLLIELMLYIIYEVISMSLSNKTSFEPDLSFFLVYGILTLLTIIGLHIYWRLHKLTI